MKTGYKKNPVKPTLKKAYLTDAPAMPEMKARLEVNAKDLPQIKDWDVGKEYSLELTGKMVSKSEGGYDGTQPLRATFEVSKVTNEDEGEED